MRHLRRLCTIALLIPALAAAQDSGHRQGSGQERAKRKPPPERPASTATAPPATGQAPDRDRLSDRDLPRVRIDNSKLVNTTGRRDMRYGVERPWATGHFPAALGPRHPWRLRGGGLHRFNLAGYFFEVAPYDYADCGDWWWDRDDIILYLDTDHDGYYLAYNVRLGTYCHVLFLGG